MPSTAASSRLDHLSVSLGKQVRLRRLLYNYGPGNGTLLVMPLDQGLEHGPADFFPNPAAIDTSFQCRLAVEGRYSAIALGIGLAEKYFKDYGGKVPLIPDHVVGRDGDDLLLTNYEGGRYRYPDPGGTLGLGKVLANDN